MAEVRYTITKDQKPTKEQIEMIEAARERGYVYDEDAPETDPVATPERYAAMMKAVAERNCVFAMTKSSLKLEALSH